MAAVFHMEIMTGMAVQSIQGRLGMLADRHSSLLPAVWAAVGWCRDSSGVLGGSGEGCVSGPGSKPFPLWGLTPWSVHSSLKHLVLPQPIWCLRRGA